MKALTSYALFVLLLTANIGHCQDQKLPEPEGAAQVRAEAVIKSIYKAEFARKSTEEMRDLAIKLVNQAVQTADDAAARFVLFREAAELAAKCGDFIGALSVIDELGQQFETDVGALKVRVMKAAAATTTVPRKLLGEAALISIPDALASGDPKQAEQLLAIAGAAAEKVKSAELKASIDARRAETNEVLQEFDKYRAALATIQQRPDDPGAHLVIGKYACFIKGDWKSGLRSLAMSNDPKLSALAKKDVDNPTEPTPQVEVGD